MKLMRHNHVRALGSILLSIAIMAGVACASSSEGDVAPLANSPTDSGVVSTVVVGTQGGLVLGPEGASVRVSAGALTGDTPITVRVANGGEYPSAPAGYVFRSKVFSFEPHGMIFKAPVVVSIPMNAGTSVIGLTGLHADPQGPWTQVQTAPGTVSAEISTSSFSFFALGAPADVGDAATADVGDAGDSGVPSSGTCSGRRPDETAPTGKLTNLLGDLPSSANNLSMTTMVDGYASISGGVFRITFSSYAKVCGYVRNNLLTTGVTAEIAIDLAVGFHMAGDAGSITPQNYPASRCNAEAHSSFVSEATFCAVSRPISLHPLGGSTGAGITITAVDARHVAGSFDFKPSGWSSTIQGTFDVPFCQSASQEPTCCLP